MAKQRKSVWKQMKRHPKRIGIWQQLTENGKE